MLSARTFNCGGERKVGKSPNGLEGLFVLTWLSLKVNLRLRWEKGVREAVRRGVMNGNLEKFGDTLQPSNNHFKVVLNIVLISLS
jgi:hypothetical protein